MPEPLPSLGPRFRVERRLERGPFFETLLAHQEGAAGFSRPVLLRVLRPELADDGQALKLLREQAALAAQFAHPNIVHLYDFGEHAGTWYLVSEFFDGRPLGDLFAAAVKTERLLSPGFVAAVGAQVCAALTYVQTRPGPSGAPLALVHRNLDPRTVVVCADGTAKIVDFAFARPAGFASYTETTRGNLAYLSPEQFRAVPVDPRSDLFSLGVVLWELVARRPFVGASLPDDVARWICEVPAPRLRTLDPTCPAELASIVARALELDPAQRFGSAAEMGQALEAFLAQAAANGAEEIRSELKRAQIVASRPRAGKGEASGLPEWFTTKPDVFDAAAGEEPEASEPALEIAPGPVAVAAAAPVQNPAPAVSAPPAAVERPGRWRPAAPGRSRAVVAAVVLGALLLLGAGGLLQRSMSTAPQEVPMVMVTSDPSGAAVRIDGAAVGVTPYTAPNTLAPGDHALEVAKEGFAPEKATIHGGDQAWHWFELKPIHMRTRPPTPGRRP